MDLEDKARIGIWEAERDATLNVFGK